MWLVKKCVDTTNAKTKQGLCVNNDKFEAQLEKPIEVCATFRKKVDGVDRDTHVVYRGILRDVPGTSDRFYIGRRQDLGHKMIVYIDRTFEHEGAREMVHSVYALDVDGNRQQKVYRNDEVPFERSKAGQLIDFLSK